MTLPTEPRICVIGAGRLGRTLIRSFERSIAVVVTSNLSSVRSASAEAGERFVVSREIEEIDPGMVDLMWLAVPDDAIERTADRLAHAHDWSNRIVVHSAGGRGRGVLAERFPDSVATAVLHPNAILDGTRPFDVGVVWGITAEPNLYTLLSELIESIGGVPLPVAEESRPLYHAAATMTANYVKTLADAALSIYDAIGIDRTIALTMIRSYLSSVTTSFDGTTLKEHLTGPAARGDLSTLREHRRLLMARLPHLVDMFDSLVETTLREVRPELLERWRKEK